ncbi:MAG: lysylphosphatidylglycerol synthase transmembrane domain-containing protein [bacterium]|nr:lysylphosphatidylglycerol synthase transmembrane domain-containing protein [bacterium]
MKISSQFNKSLFFTVTLIVGGFLFITIIEKVGVENIIKTVLTFQLWHFFVLVALGMISALISTTRWKLILDATGNTTPFGKVFTARMIGNAINYLTPSGLLLGEPFKAMVLSGKTGLSLGSTMSSVIIEGSIFLSTMLLFIIVGILAFLSYSDVSRKIFAITIGTLIILLGVFYLFFTKMVKPSGTAAEKGFFTYLIDLLRLHKISFIDSLKNKIIRRENEIKNFFQLHKKTVFTAIFLSALEIMITLAASWLTLYFLGLIVELKALLGLFSLMNISYLVPLPGSLGGFELSQIFAFGFFSLGGQATALAFTLITRLTSLVLVAIGIGYLIQFELIVILNKTADFSIKLKQKIRGFLQSL